MFVFVTIFVKLLEIVILNAKIVKICKQRYINSHE